MDLNAAFACFADPPRELGLIPFWFWNDDLEEEELLRQLRALHAAGFGGVLPHARIGLSRRVGYLTPEYFRLMRRVVEEARRLGMKVILYDEASYPSGSAQGRVVAEDPAHASRAIGLWGRDLEGPTRQYWRPNTGRALLDEHLCTVIGQIDDQGAVEPDTVRILEPLPHTLFLLETGPGSWRAMSVWAVFSGGRIRGAHPEEEDGSALAPAAADLLSPTAVACFLRHTHERYYEALGDLFGDPIIALFTDEPNVLGRGSQRPRDPRPYTPGFVDWLAQRWQIDPRPWLPALWVDYGPETDRFRRRYASAVHQRLHEVFYAAQSSWCAGHGISLTGHPSGSNELTGLRRFQLPGQDMVWRYIEPGKPSALEGPHSVAAKAATSGARLNGARRALTEVGGAYGWRLTLDELKWLFDWHLVRGNNLISPHAVFYSIRDRRAWESEPDLGFHNVLWPHLPDLATYVRRVCWTLTDGEQVCQIAILGDGNALPWQAARQLYQAQLDFLYLDDQAVAEARVEDGLLRVGSQTYRAVVLDGAPELSQASRQRLEELSRAGGLVLRAEEEPDLPSVLVSRIGRDLALEPANPDLRFLHFRKAGIDLYLLVNEGEATIEGKVTLALTGAVEVWDPLLASRVPVGVRPVKDRLRLSLSLERRQSLVIAVDPARPAVPTDAPPACPEQVVPIEGPWEVTDPAGRCLEVPAPGDWARWPGLELFSGSLTYRTRVALPAAARLVLDLGQVGEAAEVRLDCRSVGSCLWAPYRLVLPVGLEPGPHDLEIRVTNSMANAYEGMQIPSGLIGPVTLRLGAPPAGRLTVVLSSS